MEGYTPFKMKAKDYGNSPMLKNFPDAFPGGVGNSPAKGFFKRMFSKARGLAKKVHGKVGKALGLGPDKKDPTNITAATATTAPPHTHDETGAVVAEGGEVQQPVAEASAGPQSVKAIKQGPRGTPTQPGTPEHAAAMKRMKNSKFGRVGVGSSVVANTGQGMWT